MTKLMDVVNDKIEPGDYVDVDELIRELEKHGFKTNYRTVNSGPGWSWTVLVVRDGENAVEIPIETGWIRPMVMDVSELDRGEKSRFED